MNHLHRIFILILLLGLAYFPTLQTIPNGSSQLMMIDVGETQIVLNTWGTLHPTGYPHYVILGNGFVSLLRAIGVDAATAPALVSMLWGYLALVVIYAILAHSSQQPDLAFGITLLFGLTRFVWVHQVVAEIYSLALLLMALLYLLAYWPHVRYRITGLALVGGISIAHHRGIIFMIPSLIFVVWPELWSLARRKPWLVGWWVLVGVIGFIPYLYLPLRQDAAWVYGDPSTWNGFWEQFLGKEASYLGGWPDSFEQFRLNWGRFNHLLLSEVSAVGVIGGLVGLGVGIWKIRYRRLALAMTASAGLAYGFSTLLYYDILATLVLMITLALVVGWIIVAQTMLQFYPHRNTNVALALIVFIGAGWLYNHNSSWIHDKTHDRTGLETIAIAEQAPANSTLMLAWGPHHFAVGFAKDVEKRLPTLELIDHNANMQAVIAEQRSLVTPFFTFYNQPVSWWEERIGQRVYLRTIAPYLVQINTQPKLYDGAQPTPTEPLEVMPLDYDIRCDSHFITLVVNWLALEKPTRNLSVFVHVLDDNGQLIGQADQGAPVYGWRPFIEWEAQEVVQDMYPLPIQGKQVSFGLYEQDTMGQFINYYVNTISTRCP